MEHQSHVQQPVKIGDYTVYASAGTIVEALLSYTPKDSGVYLDVPLWSSLEEFKLPSDVAYVPWADFSVIPVPALKSIVNIMRRDLQNSKTVETGCAGAHGRTGTLLAAMFISIEGLNALDAVNVVREVYCDHAVETEEQIKLLHEYNGEEYVEPEYDDEEAYWDEMMESEGWDDEPEPEPESEEEDEPSVPWWKRFLARTGLLKI